MTTPNTLVDQDAATWFARWRSGKMSAHEQQQFQSWLENNTNRIAFEKLVQRFNDLKALADQPAIKSARAAALKSKVSASNPAIIDTAAKAPTRFFSIKAAAIALALCTGGIFAAAQISTLNQAPATEVFDNTSNQRETLTLADGSAIILDTQSRVSIHYSKSMRSIELEQGRAYFTVAKDTKRPFIVHTELGSVQALGTTFSVDERKDALSVILQEGRVQVALGPHVSNAHHQPITMSPGYELFAARTGWRLQPASATQALAWTYGLIVFDNTLLSDAVAAMNTHSQRKIILLKPLAAERVSGTFHIGKIEDFIGSLIAYQIAVITHETPEQITLSVPHQK